MIEFKDIQIIDNLLPRGIYDSYKNEVLNSATFKYLPVTSYGICERDGVKADHLWNSQVTSLVYANGEIFNELFKASYPLFQAIKADMFKRVKINLNCAAAGNFNQGWHRDFSNSNSCLLTGIFYMSTTDGGTLIETKDKGDVLIDCIENRFVCFPAEALHTGITHTNTKERIAVNLNYVREA